MNQVPVIEWSNNKNIHECAWCFEKMGASRMSVYGFTFCSPKCAFNHKEFEDQFKCSFDKLMTGHGS